MYSALERRANRHLTKGMDCEFRIGTSGWHYDHWVGPFYPSGTSSAKMLDYYAKHFDTVELNNTFYRLPSEAAVDRWRNAVPANFVYAVKASRFLTHRIKLKDPKPALDNFMPAIEPLGRRLGPILFQLPPQMPINVERLSALLASLPRRGCYAFEFRNVTWHTAEVYALLRKSNAAFCLYELAGYASPLEITADFGYVRLHGPGAKYQGSYSSDQLGQWAARLADWAKRLRMIYVYFDNDEAAYAVHNAASLKRLMRGRDTL